jgi:hypothetical protein
MRMLLHAIFPTEPFNALVRSGQAGEILAKIMEESRARPATAMRNLQADKKGARRNERPSRSSVKIK